jgi:bifunctional DNase/RNase
MAAKIPGPATRPSDALNLAAISDAPVYVAAGLLER